MCCVCTRPAQVGRKEGAIHFNRVSPDNIRDLFVEEVSGRGR